MDTFSRLLTDPELGSAASVIGLVVTMIGFAVTIHNVLRSKHAAEQTKREVDRVRGELSRRDAIAYSIRIHLRENWYGTEYAVVSIYNEEGSEIDTFTSLSLQDEWPEANEQLVQLYQSARRVALGVDKAIDSLLRELSD